MSGRLKITRNRRDRRSVLLCLGPFDSMNADRAAESLYGKLAQVLKRQALSQAQLGDHVRHQNLRWLRVRT